MKKKSLSCVVAVALALSLVGSSCIGSFSLTNKMLSWNRQVGNKFVNELVFFAFWVLPVYEVAGLADLLVLNSIEFWSGENPVASNLPAKRTVEGTDGRTYLVESSADGYTVRCPATGASMQLAFDAASRSWSVVTPSGETRKIMSFVDDSHVALPCPDGTETVVELSDNGLMAYRAIASEALMANR